MYVSVFAFLRDSVLCIVRGDGTAEEETKQNDRKQRTDPRAKQHNVQHNVHVKHGPWDLIAEQAKRTVVVIPV